MRSLVVFPNISHIDYAFHVEARPYTTWKISQSHRKVMIPSQNQETNVNETAAFYKCTITLGILVCMLFCQSVYEKSMVVVVMVLVSVLVVVEMDVNVEIEVEVERKIER